MAIFCGANLALVGRAPSDVPRAVCACVVTNAQSKSAHPAAGSSRGGDTKPTAGYVRNARWREKHHDRYNAGMRDYMRKRRAAAWAS